MKELYLFGLTFVVLVWACVVFGSRVRWVKRLGDRMYGTLPFFVTLLIALASVLVVVIGSML